MTGAGLVVQDLSVGYGPVRALRRVSLEVPEGAVVTVLGGNGAGKSTLLRAISRTLAFHGGAVTEGTVTLDGTVELWSTAYQAVRLARQVAGVVDVTDKLSFEVDDRTDYGAGIPFGVA